MTAGRHLPLRVIRPTRERVKMTDVRTSPGTPGAGVLICDERPAARRELTTQLASGAARVGSRPSGTATRLIEEFCVCPAGVVMIGVHRGDHAGTAAMTLLLDRHPGAHVIVYGAVHDSALLATAMTRGAHGLMIWDIGQRLTPRPLLGMATCTPRTPVPDRGTAHR